MDWLGDGVKIAGLQPKAGYTHTQSIFTVVLFIGISAKSTNYKSQ